MEEGAQDFKNPRSRMSASWIMSSGNETDCGPLESQQYWLHKQEPMMIPVYMVMAMGKFYKPHP